MTAVEVKPSREELIRRLAHEAVTKSPEQAIADSEAPAFLKPAEVGELFVIPLTEFYKLGRGELKCGVVRVGNRIRVKTLVVMRYAAGLRGEALVR